MNSSLGRTMAISALVVLATAAAGAAEVTVSSILIAYRAGATVDGLLAVTGDPANSVAMTASDLATLRGAGVPESVVLSIQARQTASASPIESVPPDDARLVDLVRLVQSGISESIITEQVRQSSPAFNLSVTDLLYLKQNGVLESIIGVLMATGVGAGAGPRTAAGSPNSLRELTFDDLVLVRPGFLKKSRPGRLILRGDTLAWVDGVAPTENFDFQIAGLQKVWFTCEARTPENFCYQINFQIVKGARYRFVDVNQESGSNASVLEVMDALRKYFPEIAFASPGH